MAEQPWFRAVTYWLVKSGNEPSQYEDASACSQREGDGSRPGRFAVADGATISVFARDWAAALAEAFVVSRGQERRTHRWLQRARNNWIKTIFSKTQTWNVAASLERGSYAALAGLHLARPRRGCSRAMYEMLAVGDCCLFHLRQGVLIRSFPIVRSAEFRTTPQLLRSILQPDQQDAEIKRTRGFWQPGDLFLITSDALAAWLLRAEEEGNCPWEKFRPNGEYAEDSDKFAQWIADLRAMSAIRNDDVTLMVIWISEER